MSEKITPETHPDLVAQKIADILSDDSIKDGTFAACYNDNFEAVIISEQILAEIIKSDQSTLPEKMKALCLEFKKQVTEGLERVACELLEEER